jgi:hypothetical protein
LVQLVAFTFQEKKQMFEQLQKLQSKF